MKKLIYVCMFVFTAIALFSIRISAASPNTLIINADLGERTISKYIYGHFAEHLGGCIYGGFWVGPDSPIPNTRGIRNDVVDALRKMKIPVLRWPGGCFADEYHWMDGIGPKEKRPDMLNTHWGMVTEDNSFGTHEFLDLCAQLECEPYICGNVGSGTVREMQQWVEYITFDGKSPMADLRRRNGHPSPWKLPFFGVGNENWGCGGTMRPEYYADLYRRYQTYVRNLSGNKIYKIACGSYGDRYDWTEILMREAGRNMNGLSYHYYTVPGTWSNKRSATQFGELGWFEVLENTLLMDEYLTKHSTIMDRYDPEKRVGLVVDEWGVWYEVEPGTNPAFLYQQNSLRDAVAAGINLNIFNNHCGRVHMANIAQTVNVLQSVILTKDNNIVLTPTYHVFEMYKVHQDAMLLPAKLTCGNYEYDGHMIPSVNVSASRDKGGRIHVTLCSLNPNKSINLDCELRGAKGTGITGRILTAPKMNSYNDFDFPDKVKPLAFSGARLTDGGFTVGLPPMSVVVLEIQ